MKRQWRDLPICFCCFERRGFKAHWAEVVVLAVVNVGHGLILQPLCQFHQRSFSWKDLRGHHSCLISLWADMRSSLTAEGLACFSRRLVFSMWFVQNVGATSHSEIVVDLSEPPVRKCTDCWAANIPRTEVVIQKFGISSFVYRINVALPVKGPNLISSKGGWKPRICRASSWEMGGRLPMQTN